MNRKEFLKTSAGFAAVAIMPGVWSVAKPKGTKKPVKFLKIKNSTPAVVTKVTPDDGLYNHTYFDVTPFSPSQRYLAISKLPFDDHMPVLGDIAEVCIIDLEKHTIYSAYKTKSWGFQTGTNVRFGATDRHVYCNDIINGTAVCVRIDLDSGETIAFAGPMYSVAPDESCIVSFPLELFDITQLGYGCPPKQSGKYQSLSFGASKTEGIWRTDLATNKKTLIVSLEAAAAVVPEKPPVDKYTYYFWHSKFNKQGTRIYQVLRCIFANDPVNVNSINLTFKPDGSEIFYTTPNYPVWGAVGGHPNWHPNGEYLIRCLRMEDRKERFVKIRYDGSEFKILSNKIEGTGHPSIDANDQYIIWDTQKTSGDNKSVSLHICDLRSEEAQVVCMLPTIKWEGRLKDSVFRLDGHPAWSRDYKKVSLQAAHEGKRQLFIVDLSKMI